MKPFIGGDAVDVIASQLQGNPGIVLTPWELEKLGTKQKSDLVPVYLPQFPATAYWWLSSCQLRHAHKKQP